MRWWKSKSAGQKLAIAAVVLAVLAVGGVVAAQRFAADEPVRPKSTAADSEEPEAAKPTGKPLKLGTVVRISSNYRVAVTELTLYNLSTGRLMVVTVEARYVGKQDGEPWGDLTVKYIGPDSRTSGEAACPFDLGDLDASDQATLKPGEVTTYAVCIALPAGKTEGGRVSVEEALARQDGAKSWSTDETVTKTPPAVAAPDSSGSSGGRDSDTGFRRPSGNYRGADNSEACEKYEDDVEEYRDGVDELDELAEQYENKPDHDEDKVEDYKEWRKWMDKNVEWFDENC